MTFEFRSRARGVGRIGRFVSKRTIPIHVERIGNPSPRTGRITDSLGRCLAIAARNHESADLVLTHIYCDHATATAVLGGANDFALTACENNTYTPAVALLGGVLIVKHGTLLAPIMHPTEQSCGGGGNLYVML